MSFPVENIRSACKAKGITLAQLERAVGIGNGVIARWEKSKGTPPIDRVQKIADYLEVPVGYLTGEESATKSGYYLNDETAAIAQEIFENKDLRALFDVTRSSDPESLKALHTMAVALKRNGGGADDDTGC